MRHSILGPAILGLATLLAACGNDPVADEAKPLPDNIVGDASGSGLAAPANAGAAEAHAQAATPLATNGESWRDTGDAANLQMSYGPPGGTPELVLSCPAKRARPTLTIVRGSAAPQDGMGTMSFTGGGHVASLPMHATAVGEGNYLWSGVASLDNARSIAKTFSTRAPVEIGVGSAAGLVVPVTPAVKSLIDRCSAQ